MTIPFNGLGRQIAAHRDELLEAIKSVVDRSAFINSADNQAFESEFAAFCGTEGCVGVANGTDALEIALETFEFESGSEVIVPALSFIATSEAITRAGLTPIFADVCARTYTLDAADVGRRINPRTVAIIGVHLYGHPFAAHDLMALASGQGLALIEDSAQAHGARIGDRTVGSFGDLATFSFYPGKNLGAFGDAGAITGSDSRRLLRARMIANHGRTSKYDHEFEGRNSRLDSLQAAVLRVKLRHLDEWTQKRIELASRYRDGLEGIGDLKLPVVEPGCCHVYHLYVVRTKLRDTLADFLRDRGVYVGIHYPTALPDLAAYAGHPQASEAFNASRLASEVLSLPMGAYITESEVETVIGEIRSFFAGS